MSDSFADFIRRRRIELGLSQAELGERISRTGSTVRRWERGESMPTRALIPTLAEALDVPARDLPAARPVAQTSPAPTEAAPAPHPSNAEPPQEAAPAPVREVTELPTELTAIPVVATPPDPQSVPSGPQTEPESLRPTPRRRPSLTRLRSPQPRYAGQSYTEDRRQRLRYWLRYLLTGVVLFVGFIILLWAFGELWTALGDVWDLFGEQTPETTALGTDF